MESHYVKENQAKKSSQSSITNFFARDNTENVQDQIISLGAQFMISKQHISLSPQRLSRRRARLNQK